ncbi:MAG: glycosyltransferase [Paracoccaceae bacterium]|nr:glycosyltransferase [Paracoccaceae bacterium]
MHDYAGHPFQAELSRALAQRGHAVTHGYFAADPGPKGRLTHQPQDAPGLTFLPLGGEIRYSKTNFWQRRAGDLHYGRALAQAVARGGATDGATDGTGGKFDLVISGNTPTEAQEPLVQACLRAGIPFVYWCQDFYSIAASRLLAARLPGPGHLIGAWYRFLERSQMQRAARIIVITEDFCQQTDGWGIPRDRVAVIRNWGAIDAIPVLGRETAWAREQGLGAAPRYLYSGTLALKHNPALLSALAQGVTDGAQVVVVAAGVGAETLATAAATGTLPALRCLPLQPFDRLAEVLGAADVLLAVIEREAGAFSVPSKILSYLCAGRPIVLAAPADNLAARLLVQSGAGQVVAPEDVAGFVSAARRFAADPQAAAAAGAAGRRHAEENFGLDRVADRFETLFTQVLT